MSMKKKRLLRVITYGLCIMMAGLVYGIFVKYTGFAIPCPIRTVTGLKCPGCGVTGMCMALLQLDFKKAFLCHPMLFVLLIPLGIVCAGSMINYVKDGTKQTRKWQKCILYASIVLLVGFGVIRNFG